MPKITIYPENIEIYISEEENLLRVLQKNKIGINSYCGGEGWCGKCKVLVKEGNPSPLTLKEKRILTEEEIEKRIRLACQIRVKEDIKIEVLNRIKELDIIYRFNLDLNLEFNPVISIQSFSLPLPNLYDQTSDTERLLRAKKGLKIKNINLIRKIPRFLRENNFQGKLVIYEDEIIDIREEEFDSPLGVAFDIGTTTLVGYLLDLKRGKEIDIITYLNPQSFYGSDIISRITYAINSKDGIKILKETILSSLKEMIETICSKNNLSPKDIYAFSIAGNPTMVHLLLGINPEYISVSPYVPVISSGMILDSQDLDLNISPFAKVYILPNISGYVGGDIIAGILAIGLWKEKGNILFVDVGTNGEIVLKTKKGIFSCATAAGPAFEGGHISSGMIAKEGAINRVWLENNDVKFSVIGDKKEEGICGSGIIDAVKVMLDLNIIDKTGRFNKGEYFSLGDVKITQRDIREFQLAKSAIRTGIEILLKDAKTTFNNIDKIYLAGAFGNYLNKDSILRIGLLPPINPEKIIFVGNSAGKGAELVLLNKDFIDLAEKLRKEIIYIELSGRKDFQDYFVEFMYF
ncbi:MAG: ASKHA domain-containing protein [Dictyoglomus sp.]|nr:ASKHA domain-containing protein [Dictyoglomus sp.]MDW8188207.1 ASKHA domain-containing protein [Dictyoglomus sp.]